MHQSGYYCVQNQYHLPSSVLWDKHNLRGILLGSSINTEIGEETLGKQTSK